MHIDSPYLLGAAHHPYYLYAVANARPSKSYSSCETAVVVRCRCRRHARALCQPTCHNADNFFTNQESVICSRAVEPRPQKEAAQQHRESSSRLEAEQRVFHHTRPVNLPLYATRALSPLPPIAQTNKLQLCQRTAPKSGRGSIEIENCRKTPRDIELKQPRPSVAGDKQKNKPQSRQHAPTANGQRSIEHESCRKIPRGIELK